MFIGRSQELAVLEEAYAIDSFQMVVVYGRRRVGKSTLRMSDSFRRVKPLPPKIYGP